MEELTRRLMKESREGFKVKVVGKFSGLEVELDWKILRRALETIQKLAPIDLRSPPEYLDELYELKRNIKNFVETEMVAEDQYLIDLVKYEHEVDLNADTPIQDNSGQLQGTEPAVHRSGGPEADQE